MKVIFLVIIFPVLYNFVCCGDLDERLPSAMNEEDYQALYNALLAGKIDVLKRDINSRRIYRRLLTGRYVLKETQHPITGKMTKNIVSITILF